MCYDNGEGVEQDHARAIDYYEQAAKMGDAHAIRSELSHSTSLFFVN